MGIKEAVLMRSFYSIALLILFVPLPLVANGLTYFPLQVGNTWQFRHHKCTERETLDTYSHGYECTCTARDEVVLSEVTVVDTVRLIRNQPIPLSYVDDLPISLNGELYYVLEGSFVEVFFGMWERIDRILVRYADSTLPVVAPHCAGWSWDTFDEANLESCIESNSTYTGDFDSLGMSFSAVHLKEGQWRIFPLDLSLFYFGTEWTSWLLSTSDHIDHGTWGCRSTSSISAILDRAVDIIDVSTDVRANYCEYGPINNDVLFASDIGIVALERHCGAEWELVKARVNGVSYGSIPTVIREQSWGRIKYQR